MKKLIMLLVVCTTLLTSCNVKRRTVTFVDGDTTSTSQTTVTGRIDYPYPVGQENSVFDGWYFDETLKERVPDNYVPTDDVTVYAGYAPDYQTLVNAVYTDYIRANVTIEVTHYVNPWNTLLKQQGQGSGVIILEDASYYYCVTNDHVTESIDGYPYAYYTVNDCYGSSYEAKLLYSDPSSDLSLLAFRKSSTVLRAVEISKADAEVGERVIAIGQPDGLINTTTFGTVDRIATVDVEGAEEYSFKSIWHDAPMDHGSSGGALLDDSLKLVGINYAVATDVNGNVTVGFAIPASRLLEFVEAFKNQ